MYEKELIELSKSGARYLVVEGIALAFHNFPRATFDLDIMPDLNSENLGIIADTLKSLGYTPKIPVDVEELKDPRKREYWHTEKNMEVFSFINLREPTDMVDLMIYSPLDFEECFTRKVMVTVYGTQIYIASVEDMLTLKRMSMRPQDMRDIAVLETIMEEKNK